MKLNIFAWGIPEQATVPENQLGLILVAFVVVTLAAFLLRWWLARDQGTGHKSAKSLLQPAPRHLELFFEHASEAYYLTDFNGHILTSNLAAEKLFGCRREVFIGKSLVSLGLIPESQLMKVVDVLAQNVQGKSTGPDTFNFLSQGNSHLEVEISTYPLEMDDQPVILCVARDITSQRKLEVEFQQIKDFNAEIIENVVEGIVVVGEDETLTFINPAAAAMLDYSPQDLIGEHWKFIICSEDQAAVEAADQRRAQGVADRYEIHLRHRDGSHVPVMVSGAPRIMDGRFAGSVAVFSDVSQVKSAEIELLKLRKAVEASGDAVFMTDRDGLITYVNPGFTTLYGFRAEEVIGQVTPRILKSGELSEDAYAYFWQALLNKEVIRGELVNKTKSGELVHVTGSANPILDDEGEIIGFLAIQGDITERVQVEEAERDARNLAEQRASELEVLENVAESLNLAATLGDPLEPALATVMDLVDADAGWIVLLEPSGETLLAAAHNLPPELIAGDYAALRWSACNCQKKLLAGDLTDAIHVMECERTSGLQLNGFFQQHVTIPLRVGEKALGNLNLCSYQEEPFSDENLRILTAVGDQFGVAIERARLFGEVRELAITDALTGLYNRRHLFELGIQTFEQVNAKGDPLAVLMLDLDHFKNVNDTFGHAIGDRVLQEIAHRLRLSLREIDILGRYGGEEFVALLPGSGIEGALQVAERLCRTVGQEHVETEKGPVRVTVSLGVAPYDEKCASFDDLIERADQALYAAKQTGRNQVSFWKSGED